MLYGMRITLRIAFIAALVALPLVGHAADRLRMATTTSTQNSGLLKVLDPPFEKENNVKLDVIAVGTGKALKLGEEGDVDVVFVHAPSAEEKFMAAGYGVGRKKVMHNDFVVVGPPGDPAGIRDTKSAVAAFKRIAQKHATFISRGDDSGTNKKEWILWRKAGIKPSGHWYQAVGQGMGAVLQMADEKQAYTLTDRGTYLAYEGRIGLVIVSQGAPVLYNPYHIIAVNPKRYPDVKYNLAEKYIKFVTGPQGQSLIRNYRVKGQQLFHPDVIP